MKPTLRVLMLWCLALITFGTFAIAQSSSKYDVFVEQGRTKLQAGRNEEALTVAKEAINTNPNRWEAYAVAGGALMDLKRYEEAADQIGRAIERAPETKQAGLRDLRKQCLILEAGTTVVSNQPSSSVSLTTSDGPSYADTVKWIQEHIKEAGVPGMTFELTHPKVKIKGVGSLTETTDDERFSIKVNGCASMDLALQYRGRTSDSDPEPGDPSTIDTTEVIDFKVPFSGSPGEAPQMGGGGPHTGVFVLTDTHLQSDQMMRSKEPVRNVVLAWTGELVTASWSQNSGAERRSATASNFGSDPYFEFVNPIFGTVVPSMHAVRISYGMPGTSDPRCITLGAVNLTCDDPPTHMAKALQHLIILCRQNPGAAPKDLF